MYPLSLYSLFQRRRADNTFRNLHWLPAGILLVWLLLQGIVLGSTVEQDSVALYSWGWALGPVLLGFVWLVLFCLFFISRRPPRLIFLSLILIPFAAAAFLSEQEGNWEQELAAVMWSGDFWKVDESGFLARFVDGDRISDEKNLEVSDNEQEEDWRERLRMQERREQRIADRVESNKDEAPVVVMQDSSSSTGREYESSSSRPTKLPDSGFGWSAIILTLIAGYCAALNESARKRVES